MGNYRKKLIEVALPLEAINAANVVEKAPRPGHPSSFHLWWARRPLAACRAVLFASLVDDPSSHPEQFPTDEAQEAERQRLFKIIEDLVKWENSNSETVLNAARKEILKSANGNPPPILDPFCGGGSIPLEAQRLGLEAHASDLNPVAVLITKALIEIPPKFAGRPPVNPESRKKLDHTKSWHEARGLAEDVRYYGQWMRDEAEKRIGYLYPKVKLPKEYGSSDATVIAWLWARTVKCPNPACGAQMPLVRSFWLSTKAGRKAWVAPSADQKHKIVRFEVKAGNGSPPEGTKQRGKSRCLLCFATISDAALREQATRQGIEAQLMAVVAEGSSGRIYLSPDVDAIGTPKVPKADWLARPLSDNARWFSPPGYGLKTFRDLFTSRQLVALTTFSELVGEARERVLSDASRAGLQHDSARLNDGGSGVAAYADAVTTYLGLNVSRLSNRSSNICFWDASGGKVQQVFARQAIPMTWDFAEANPFSDSTGNFLGQISYLCAFLDIAPTQTTGIAKQLDAAITINGAAKPLVCTDPPYYDNIGYADLSDFFYLWLRRCLGKFYPDLFSTLLTPKAQELIATPYRFDGDKAKAERFFEEGVGKAFARMREVAHPAYPLAVFYAFKQAESEEVTDITDSQASVPISTGWETMLGALLKSGFAITGTWPTRTELIGNLKKLVNALASSIVVVCRPRLTDAPLATRREFIDALKSELPSALKNLQRGNIAPVDLAQAAIGPGMAVFSRYSKVIEADGSQMTVRTALALINQALDEVLAEQEGEFDSDTRWAVAWFEQRGFQEGPFGEADVLARAKNTAVKGLEEAGILKAKAGKVCLLNRAELDGDWDPMTAHRLTVWEVTHQLIRALEKDGEAGAAALLRKVGALGETARDLAYRLYGICERKKWAQEGLAYNSLVIAWPEIVKLARQREPSESQAEMFRA
jgi:putative DNA methylase